MMKVRIMKLHPGAVIPSYAKPGDAGLDLTAISIKETDKYVEYGTGLAVEIPEGYMGLIFPRSSVSKKDLIQANCVGVVDSGYRGEVCVRFKKLVQHKDVQVTGSTIVNLSLIDKEPDIFGNGERVAQLIIVPYPVIELEDVEELTATERGEGGFGSTDEKKSAE